MSVQKILVIVLLVCIPCIAGSTGVDVVVMVDISESMFPFFDDVVDYLLRDLLENRLHQGDSFHLLSFADSPAPEVKIDIAGAQELQTVIDRILLLEPLGQYTDLIAAVDFLYEYTGAIPAENKKLVLLLTDGIHDPPPGSPNRLDKQQVLSRLLESSEKIKKQGWDVHIMRMPGRLSESQSESSEREGSSAGTDESGMDLLHQLSRELDTEILEYEEIDKESMTDELTGFSTLDFPGDLGRVRRRFRAPFTVNNHSAQPIRVALTAVHSAAGSLLLRPSSVTVGADQSADLSVALRLPPTVEKGVQRLTVSLEFEDPELRISPLSGELQLEYVPVFGWFRTRIPLPYLLYGLGALVLIGVIILLIIVVRRRLQDASFDRLFAGVSAARTRRRSGRQLIMKVDMQNPNIGSRNIHAVPPGSKRSVGGDGSTFLIYYISVPRRIGEIRNDGKRYSFVPRKSEFFPDLHNPLADCLEKPIRAVSSRGREIIFHFHEYVSPLEALNRLMRSVPKYNIGNVPLKRPSPGENGSGDTGRD